MKLHIHIRNAAKNELATTRVLNYVYIDYIVDLFSYISIVYGLFYTLSPRDV